MEKKFDKIQISKKLQQTKVAQIYHLFEADKILLFIFNTTHNQNWINIFNTLKKYVVGIIFNISMFPFIWIYLFIYFNHLIKSIKSSLLVSVVSDALVWCRKCR